MRKVLGVDINGPIVERLEPFNLFNLPGDRHYPTRLVDGAVDALQTLRQAFDTIYVISVCRPRQIKHSRAFLEKHDFYQRSGIRFEDVHYCFGKGSKAPVCAQLGVTHFVDDRLEVLSSLESVPHKFLFDGRKREIERMPRSAEHLSKVQSVETWAQLLPLLS